jgi:nicotinamide-nucleotide amidase
MWEQEVELRLRDILGAEVLVTRTLKTIGVGESHIDEMMAPLLKSQNPTVGIYAKVDGVHVRLGAKAATEEAARKLIAPVEEEARRILGDIVWGAADDSLGGVIGEMMDERGLTLATMESCTGGLLASTITDVSGSSTYFKGGYVAYTERMKMMLGVSAELIETHGVVSAEVAGDMARAARHSLDADYGIGVTGVAGPDDLEGKPPGTIHVAVHDGRAPEVVSYTFYQGRMATKRRAVTTALFLLRRSMLAHH